jgi:hypothetical protein
MNVRGVVKYKGKHIVAVDKWVKFSRGSSLTTVYYVEGTQDDEYFHREDFAKEYIDKEAKDAKKRKLNKSQD